MPPSPRSPLERMLTIGRAAYDFVGTTEADAAQVDRAARRNELIKLYPSPMATADVVLAVPPGDRGVRLRDLVAGRAGKSLTDSGWKAPGATGLPADQPQQGKVQYRVIRTQCAPLEGMSRRAAPRLIAPQRVARRVVQ